MFDDAEASVNRFERNTQPLDRHPLLLLEVQSVSARFYTLRH